MDPLVSRFAQDPAFARVLKEAGLFLQNYAAGGFVSNQLWDDLGHQGRDLARSDSWTAYLHPDDRVDVLTRHQEVLEGRSDRFHAVYRMVDQHGHWHWIRHQAWVLQRSADGQPSLYVGHDSDVTNEQSRAHESEVSRRHFERRYQQAEQLRAANANVSIELNPRRAVEKILSEASHLLPYDAAVVWTFEGARLRWLGGVGVSPDAESPFAQGDPLLQKLVDQKTPQLLTHFCEQYPNTLRCRETPYAGWLGVPLCIGDQVIGVMEFLTIKPGSLQLDHLWAASILAEQTAITLQNAHLFTQTETEASTDSLTGLLTRRSFERLAVEPFSASGVYKTVLMLDLDHFKQVNDAWGHDAGDQVLRTLATVFRSIFRGRDLVCRWGGEEFAVLMTGRAPVPALRMAERIRTQLASAHIDGYPQLSVTCSIGVANEEASGTRGLPELLALADHALYKAKSAGRNQVQSVS